MIHSLVCGMRARDSRCISRAICLSWVLYNTMADKRNGIIVYLEYYCPMWYRSAPDASERSYGDTAGPTNKKRI